MSAPDARAAIDWRRWLVTGVFVAAAVGLAARAVQLQVLDSGFLQQEGKVRHQRLVSVPASRGAIVDRNGESLAVSTPVDSVWANPGLLLGSRELLAALSDLLGFDFERLHARLAARGDREFVYLRRHLHPDRAREVKAIEAPGVGIRREYRRYYPTGEVSAQLLGFNDIDDRGQEGLELAHDGWLGGTPGSQRVIKDRVGHAVEHVERVRQPDPGRELVLSVDRRLQYLAYRELKAAVQHHAARAASAVLLDPRSGEVLAMVNQPSFNPNNRTERATDGLRNRAVTDVFEPGSAIKPFTVAIALESGGYHAGSLIDTGSGRLAVSEHVIRDSRALGEIDVAEVLRRSSNVGASLIALELDPDQLWKGLRSFGFGEHSGSGFPGESTGFLPHHDRWQRLDQATLGFGYGVSVTAAQLARAYASFAADGLLRPLSFTRVEQSPPTRRVLSVGTARALRGMLESVVGDQGTAQAARVRGYRVAGKTGTARKSIAGGYAEDRYVSVFVGMAPASRPRLVLAVVIDEPREHGYYGGEVAAPVFSRVMSGALRLLNVPPDDLPALRTGQVARGAAS